MKILPLHSDTPIRKPGLGVREPEAGRWTASTTTRPPIPVTEQSQWARLIAFVCALSVGSASSAAKDQPPPVPEIAPGLMQGYLPKEAMPNSLALLPAPPAVSTAAFTHDLEVARNSIALRGSPRWAQATLDANLHFPDAVGTFSCALNAPITQEGTPYLYQLLQRTLTDGGLSTYTAKNHYQRARPFMSNKAPVCTPDEVPQLEKDGSYPSGHTAVGWTWALILTEIAPDRAEALIARGLAYGESRNVCNVHWYSDVVQGRNIAAAAVARLHAEPEFRSDLDKAKAELADVRAQAAKPTRDCVAEAAALGSKK